MPSSTIIALIIALLVCLVAYAFVTQTLDRKRKQRQRIENALKQRSKDFGYMATRFPGGFLPKELHALVVRCLIEVNERLAKLNPRSNEYVGALTEQRKLLEDIKRRPGQHKHIKLDNPQQVKEVKTLLQGLNTFIAQQQQKGKISTSEFSDYEKQIKRLVIQITVDAYVVSARQAESSDKGRLAIHYYGLARKLLAKEGLHGEYAQLMQEMGQNIQTLEQSLSEMEPEYESDREAERNLQQVNDEWQRFSAESEEEEAKWKKKSLYD